MRPVVCSIGTTEPWNAAGLGLDLLALPECRARPVTVVAGVSAQDDRGVHALVPMPASLIAAQFSALSAAGVAAYRVGALLDVASVETVAKHLRRVQAPVVYDPVFAPSGGGAFVDEAVVTAVRTRLLPVVTVVTPNLGEAARLLGAPPASDPFGMAAAAGALLSLGANAALVKGGHLPKAAVDVLVDGERTRIFEGSRLPGTMRGTGCLLAAALAAGLARGLPLEVAVLEARAFVRRKFERAQPLGPMRSAY